MKGYTDGESWSWDLNPGGLPLQVHCLLSFLATSSLVGAKRQDVPNYEWSVELEIA